MNRNCPRAQTPSRRRFLQRTLAAGGALALAARGGPQSFVHAVAAKDAKMAVARWDGELSVAEDLEAMQRAATRLTEQAIANLGGMGRFVSKGDVVWIKPNIGFHIGPAFAANTNPDVVATLVRLCQDAGAKTVRVGDNSCYGAFRAYPDSGIEEAVKAVDGEVVYLSEDKMKETKLGGERLDSWPMCTEMLEADVLINVPIVKQHALTKITVCMKNLMGVAAGPRQAAPSRRSSPVVPRSRRKPRQGAQRRETPRNQPGRTGAPRPPPRRGRFPPGA